MTCVSYHSLNSWLFKLAAGMCSTAPTAAMLLRVQMSLITCDIVSCQSSSDKSNLPFNLELYLLSYATV